MAAACQAQAGRPRGQGADQPLLSPALLHGHKESESRVQAEVSSVKACGSLGEKSGR